MPEQQETAHAEEHRTTESTVERFLAARVQERRRKLRMAMWISFLVGGFLLVVTALTVSYTHLLLFMLFPRTMFCRYPMRVLPAGGVLSMI